MDELQAKNKAMFLDRDGVIVKDVHLLTEIKQLELIDDIENLISLAIHKEWLVFIVTNQTVISRGLINLEQLDKIHKELQKMITDKNKNALINEIFVCPHHPEADIVEYRVKCECRKPRPGMLHLAATKYNLALQSCYFVGDRLSDIVAGNVAGVKTILLNGEMTYKPLIKSNFEYEEKMLEPSFKVASISEIISLLEKQ